MVGSGQVQSDGRSSRSVTVLFVSEMQSCDSMRSQWRNDGVAAASSDGGPTGGRGPPTVLEFLVINFSVCLVLLTNNYCYWPSVL